MRNLNVTFLWIFLLLISVLEGLFAQEDDGNRTTNLSVFNDYSFQPEVYSFPKPVEAGVGPGGNLNLSIPVLSVPGRGGLGFDISFSYSSGITVDAEASWIGLGWNFDPGSITRDVKGHLQGTGPDYEEEPNEQPDSYFLKIPGYGTYEMVRSNLGQFNQNTPILYPALRQEGDFHLRDYEPFKIEYKLLSELNWHDAKTRILDYYDSVTGNTIVNSDDDIGLFMVTTDNGNQYIYANPSMAKYNGIYPGLNTNIAYVNAWRLVAIIGPGEEVDLDTGFEFNRSFFETNFTKWVLFNYDFLGRSMDSRPERYYLSKISTPTHTAEIELLDRLDWTRFGESFWVTTGEQAKNIKRLASITLKNKSGQVLKKIELDQGYSLAPSWFDSTGDGKLTLNNIHFKNSANVKSNPGYKFEYAFNPLVYQDAGSIFDPFGFYVDIDGGQRPWNHSARKTGEFYDCSAWSLTKLTNPTGAVEEYIYESNYIADDIVQYSLKVDNDAALTNINMVFNLTGDNLANTGNIKQSGGPRVSAILKSVEGNQILKNRINYFYGNGSIQGLPPKIVNYIEYLRPSPNEFHQNSRGKAGITYDYIRKEVSGSEALIEESYYTTGNPLYSGMVGIPSVIQPMQNIIWSSDNVHFVYFSQDYSPLWGKLYKQVVSKLSGAALDKRTEIYYGFDYKNRIMGNDFTMDFNGPEKSNILNQFFSRMTSKKIIERYNNGESITISNYYSRNDSTLQIMEEDKIVDGNLYKTHTVYAYDHYTDAFNTNQLNLVAKEWTEYYKNPDLLNEKKTISANITTYKLTSFTYGSLWLPERNYILDMTDLPVELPSFNGWDNENNDSGWKFTKSNTFNANLELSRITMPLDKNLELFYGDNTNPVSNSGDMFANTLVTAIRFNADGKSLTRKIKYNDLWWKASEIIDENDHSKFFEYDVHGRLLRVKNSGNQTVNENAIEFSRFLSGNDDYDPAKPNRLTSTAYLNDTENSIVYSYFDDWSRSMQTVSLGENYDIYTSQSYNSLGQVASKQNNYQLDKSLNGVYDINRGQRLPNGDYYESDIATTKILFSAGLINEASNYYTPVKTGTIDLNTYSYPLPDSVSWKLGATFFNLAGAVSVEIKKNGVVEISDIITEERPTAGTGGNFFLTGRSEYYKFDIDATDVIDIQISISAPEEEMDLILANPNLKRYIISTLTTNIENRDFSNIKPHTDYFYSNSGEELKQISHPGQLNNVFVNHRYVKMTDVGIDQSFQPYPDTIIHYIPEPHLVKPTLINDYFDSYTYNSLINHTLDLNWQALASSTGFSASISVTSNAPGFTPINETISGTDVSKAFFLDVLAGYQYVISSSTSGLEFKINDANDDTGMIQNPSNSQTLIDISFALGEGDDDGGGGGGDDDGEGPPTGLFSEVRFNAMIEELEIIQIDPVLKESETIDEEGKRSYGYINGLGQNVLSIQKNGTEDIRTYFEYDEAGNLTKVYTPNYFDPPNGNADDWVITYSYNTLGQLLEKETPDDGTTEYIYNSNGNLVFSQNEQERSDNTFKFTVYDEFIRPAKVGIATGDYTGLDPDTYNPGIAIISYYYDNPVTGISNQTLNTHVTAFPFSNSQGKLVLVESKGITDGKEYIELYSYDDEGRVKEKWLVIEDLDSGVSGDSKRIEIEYTYNLQGMLLTRDIINSSDLYSFRYDYDGLMNLDKVFFDAGTGEVEIADYDYTTEGMIANTDFSSVDGGLSTANSYNIRSFLTNISNSTSAADIFTAEYSFLANGNIGTATYYTSKFTSDKDFRYNYQYDGINRLTNAQFQYLNGSTWTNSNRYTLNNLAYDPNGNIETLKRYDQNSVLIDDLTFTYSGSNRITGMSDGVASTSKKWDAEDTQYTYDLIGNVTIINRTGGDDVQLQNFDINNLPERIIINGSEITTCRYNGSGQRIFKKTDGASAEFYIMDGNICLGVLDEDGNVKYINLHGNDLLGRYEP